MRPGSLEERLTMVERDIAALKLIATGRANDSLVGVQLANQALAELRIIRAQMILNEREFYMSEKVIATKGDIDEAERRILEHLKASIRPPSVSSVDWAAYKVEKWTLAGLRSLTPAQREMLVRRVFQAIQLAILALTTWLASKASAVPAASPEPRLLSPTTIVFADGGADQ